MSPTFPWGNNIHFTNHDEHHQEALPQLWRLVLSFRHFNLILPNIPCNSSVVNFLMDLLGIIGSLSGITISGFGKFFCWWFCGGFFLDGFGFLCVVFLVLVTNIKI